MNKKRILILHHGTGLGGGLIALLGLIDDLKKQHDVDVFCIFDGEAVDYIKKKGVNVYFPQARFFQKYNLFIHSAASYASFLSSIKSVYYFFLFLLNSIFFASRELSKFNGKYDILYLNSLFITDWLPFAKKYFSKVVVHVREPLYNGVIGIRKYLIRFLLKKYADLIICVSEDNKNRINIPSKSVRVYDPVVNSDRGNSSLQLPKDDLKYFVYVGGSQRIKGFEQLVKSLDFLDENVRIYFLGNTYELVEDSNKINFKIRSLFSPYLRKVLPTIKKKIYESKNIIFIGKTNDVFDYYGKALAILCPFSKPHACLPILESYSIGKPVIVSNVEGMEELYNKKFAKMFENNDYKDFAVKINELSKLPLSDIERMGEDAKSFYLELTKNNPEVNVLVANI